MYDTSNTVCNHFAAVIVCSVPLYRALEMKREEEYFPIHSAFLSLHRLHFKVSNNLGPGRVIQEQTGIYFPPPRRAHLSGIAVSVCVIHFEAMLWRYA